MRTKSSSAPTAGTSDLAAVQEGRGDLPMTAPISTQLREDHHGVIPYAGTNLALYQIEERLAELLELRNIAAEEGDAEALAAIDKQFEEYFLREVKKVDGICHALMVFSEAEDAARREAKRLTERADAHRAKFDRIKAATLKAMQDHGVRVLETPTNKLRVQANGGKEPLEIFDLVPADLTDIRVTLPEDLWQLILQHILEISDNAMLAERIEKESKEVREPNGDCIRAALKRGEEVPGAKLLPRGYHLRIE